MKSLILVIVLMFVPAAALIGQEENPLDRLMTRHAVTCGDVFFNSTMLIPRFYLKNDLDSLRMVLKYWDDHCGPNEWAARTRILLAINDSTFRESLYDHRIIGFMVNYYWRARALRENILFNNRQIADQERDYLEFTSMLARKAVRTPGLGPVEYAFARYYSGVDTSLTSIMHDPGLRSSVLHQYFDTYLLDVLDENEYDLTLYSSAWIPLGNNAVLGVHPELGFQLGIKYSGWLADISLALRFGQAKQEYLVNYKGNIVSTKHFLGGFIGIDGGRELWRNSRHEVDALFGFGYDGFDAIQNGNNSSDNRSINSLNINGGIGYRYYLSPHGSDFVGFAVRYNVVHYATDGGTDLSGNTITLRFTYGWFGPPDRIEKLEALGYTY